MCSDEDLRPRLLCQPLCYSVTLSALVVSVFFFFCAAVLCLPFHSGSGLALCLLLPDQNVPFEIYFAGLNLAPSPCDMRYGRLDFLLLSVAL